MGRAPTGLPHSDPPGSQAASASPGHFAAWPRPSSAAIAKASTLRPSSGRLTTSRFLTLSPDQDSYLQLKHQTGSRQRQDEPTAVTRPLADLLTLGFPVQVLSSARQDSCFIFFDCFIVSMQCAWMNRHDIRRPPCHPRPQDPAGLAWRVVKVHKLGKRNKRTGRTTNSPGRFHPLEGGRAWTRTRDLGLIRAAL